MDKGLSRRFWLTGAAATGLVTMSVSACARAQGFASAAPPPRSLDPVLAELHRRTFDYFWQSMDPDTGLHPDNWPNPNFCSIAAVGFGLSAHVIGVQSGYVSRAEAARRARLTLQTLWSAPQGPQDVAVSGHKGFFYHFLDMKTALRFKTCELSSVDTALMMAGALTCAAFFDGADADESEIRRLAQALYDRIDWTFLERDSGLISMGWRPESGLIERNWDRYNEGMLVYLLALGSSTHPIRPEAWANWMQTLPPCWGENFGQTYLGFSPLFGHQYSHVWYDFRGIADAFMRSHQSTYFDNSRQATLAQYAYARQNPGGFKGYGPVWGLTACQGPGYIKAKVGKRDIQFNGYGARGIQDGDNESFDDGTIAPTAGISSIVFTPELSTALVHTLRERYGDEIYGELGFVDAFNPSFPPDLEPEEGHVAPRAGWVAKGFLGIDQGPILCMLENYRSGLIWDLMCRSAFSGPGVRRAFKLAGFEPVAPEGAWLNR